VDADVELALLALVSLETPNDGWLGEEVGEARGGRPESGNTRAESVEIVLETSGATTGVTPVVGSQLQEDQQMSWSSDDQKPTPYDYKKPIPGHRYDFDWMISWYRNDHKVDSLFSQLVGRLETERKETASKAHGTTGKVGLDLGGILAKLGLAKVSAEGELRADRENILEITSSLSMDNKMAVLLSALEERGQLDRIRLFEQPVQAIVEAMRPKHFQVLSGWFWPIGGENSERSEIASDIQRPDGNGPLIRVPLLRKFFLPIQNMPGTPDDEYDEGIPFAHEVFCSCTLRPGWILASPVAIWFPHVDAETSQKLFGSDGAWTDALRSP
jgi:hypothetical protein